MSLTDKFVPRQKIKYPTHMLAEKNKIFEEI